MQLCNFCEVASDRGSIFGDQLGQSGSTYYLAIVTANTANEEIPQSFANFKRTARRHRYRKDAIRRNPCLPVTTNHAHLPND